MKRLLTYLFLVLLSVCSMNQSVVFAETTLIAHTITNSNYIYFISPDKKNFNKELYWKYRQGFRIEPSVGWEEYEKQNGRSCFYYHNTFTYDAKQFGHSFYYDSPGSGQTNVCVPEVYKIYTQPNNSIYDVVGLDKNTGIPFGKGLTYRSDNEFVVITSEVANKLCIKAAYSEGVGEHCYDLRLPKSDLVTIVNKRLTAIKAREEAKGNIVSTSTPTEIETSVTDTSGPQIEVPGKLIAKNDQVILSGKITDENNIASVKIDNS